ncbi:glycosyltransferase [Agromyces seonyuensis]|nr:glycosyltransferase [Agromyces seonyuensis]
MFPGISAVLVVRHGGDRLQRTLEAIAAQRGTPSSLVVVLLEPDDAIREQVGGSGASHVVELPNAVPFGEAVEAGLRMLPPSGDERAALWLLAEDTAPEPGVLAALAAALETSPSVGIAGPKVVEWDRADRLVSIGRTMTRLGRTVELVEPGLDQGQEDGRSDVLAVAPAGLLVRRAVWDLLGGFDPGLPQVDAGLDLGVRARLAGHRVVVVPEARVAFAGDGIAESSASKRGRTRRRTDRRVRRAALHRRLAYAPAWAVPLHWLAILPLAIARSIGMLVAKRPAAIGGELAAAGQALVGVGAAVRARARIRRTRTERWSRLAPLRLPPAEETRRRQAARELRRDRARGRRHELHFLAAGGGWVLLVALLVSLVLNWRLLGFTGVAGEALEPLSGSVAELWSNAAYGWRELSVGFLAPADPFAGLLAIIGTLAFWFPPAGVTLVWLLAIPAAAMGAWMLGARLSDRASVRTVAATVWALAPMFLTALSDGRPAAVLVHVLLPWLAFAALGAAGSWASAGAAALLFAAVIACAPSLAPLLVVAWLVALVLAGRGAARVLWMPVPALALALPVILASFDAGVPLGAFADPGLPAPGVEASVWQLAAGFPGGGWGGWAEVFAASPFDAVDPRVLAVALLAPLALLAVGSLAAPAALDGLAALAFAGGGFATAVAASRISVETIGSDSVGVWTGAGLSAGLLGLLVAAVCALRALRRYLRSPLAVVLAATGVVVSLPLTVVLATGGAGVHSADARTLPAVVTAEAEHDPNVTTLLLVPEEAGGLRATLEHGAGTTLDEQSTLWYTGARAEQTAERSALLAEAAGNLASRSGFDVEAAVEEFGVRYVLLAASDGEAGDEADAVRDRATLALDSNPDVVVVADTAFGRLWRVVGAEPGEPGAAPLAGPGTTGLLVTIVQLAVLLVTLLLSIPVGAAMEPARERRRRPRPPRRSRRAIAVPPEVEPDGDADDATADSNAEDAAADVLPEAEAEPDSESEPEPQSESESEPDTAPEADPRPAPAESESEPQPRFGTAPAETEAPRA